MWKIKKDRADSATRVMGRQVMYYPVRGLRTNRMMRVRPRESSSGLRLPENFGAGRAQKDAPGLDVGASFRSCPLNSTSKK